MSGKFDAVVVSLENYNQMLSELELLKMLSESEGDVIDGRVKPFSESLTDIRNKL